MKLEEFKQKVFREKPQVKAEYDKQTPYWELQRQLIEARIKSKLTQEQIAQKMNVAQSAVARFEKSENCNVSTLIEYAKAVGLKKIVIPVE